MSELLRTTTPDPVNISDTLLQKEFTTALQHLKLGKAKAPVSIFQELIVYAGDALKSCLGDCLSSCLP